MGWNRCYKCKIFKKNFIFVSRDTIFLFSGQQLAHQMQATNPELVEQLRRQMGGPGGGPNPFDPSAEPESKDPQ